MSRARVLLPILLSLLIGIVYFGATTLTSAVPDHAVAAGSNVLQFFDPVSVVVDHSGNVYVFQRGTSRIHKISPRGQPRASWKVSTARTFPGPGRLMIDGKGNVSVLLGNSRLKNAYVGGIQSFSPTGQVVDRWYSPALLNAQLLAAGSDGALYVVAPVSLDGGARQSGRVVELSSAGRVVASWALSRAGYDYITPAGIATDTHGNVYVSGSVGSCSRGCQGREADVVERFKPSGTTLSILRFPPGTVGLGPGLAIDGHGTIYAGGDTTVTEVSSSGRIIRAWGGTAGCGALQFRAIAGLALAGSTILYVVDESNDNLQQVNLVTQSVTVWGGCPAPEPPAPGLPTRAGDRGIK